MQEHSGTKRAGPGVRWQWHLTCNHPGSVILAYARTTGVGVLMKIKVTKVTSRCVTRPVRVTD